MRVEEMATRDALSSPGLHAYPVQGLLEKLWRGLSRTSRQKRVCRDRAARASFVPFEPPTEMASHDPTYF